jgi:acetyltransferase-like isoleucine patch superfamily enzyme
MMSPKKNKRGLLNEKCYRLKNLLISVLKTDEYNLVHKPRITVGKYSYGVEKINTSFGGAADIVIGSFTSIAGNLSVQLGGNHNSDWISTYPFGHGDQNNAKFFGPPIPNHPVPARSVSIGNDVWIGNNVTIMGGLNIADGAIIAMNSHVVSNVGAYEVYGGNPAKKIRDRFDPELTRELITLKWWEFEDKEIMQIKNLLASAPTMQTILEIKSILNC